MKKIITWNFNENFIENTAEYIVKNYPGRDLSKLAVVFGGKRPALFLKQRLSQIIKNVYYPPRFFNIDEFFEYIFSKKEKARRIDELDACYRIYLIIKEKMPELLNLPVGFPGFIAWAREILGFIDEVDSEQIGEKTLKNIENNADIGYEVPENINKLLSNIVTIRNTFHAQLEKDKLFSKGMLIRSASQYIKEISLDEFESVIFCGFFDLSASAKRIISHLIKNDKAVLLFQSSDRAWPQFMELSAYFNSKIEPETNYEPDYTLKIYSGFNMHSQVGIVREIIKGLKDVENSVIVLPDANALIPLVSEISSICNEFNVSMGYPLRRSALYSLFKNIIKSQTTRKNGGYYTRDYLRLIKHPLVKNLNLAGGSNITRIIVHKLEDLLTGKEENKLGGSLFVKLKSVEGLDILYGMVKEELKDYGSKLSSKDMESILKQLHKYCFKIWEKVSAFDQLGFALVRFLDMLTDKSFLNNYAINLNATERIYGIADSFLNLSFKDERFANEDILKIFEEKLKSENISFSGMPLKGLQILGLFETRSLSFDNVIIMDVNESVLPRLKVNEPLIPRQVMMNLGINRLETEDTIQRYHFQRLLSSAKNVYLVYDDSADKQRSRLIEEIVWNQEKKNRRLDVVDISQAVFNLEVTHEEVIIQKSKEMISLLKNFNFSASSIDTYLHCPLQFYYRYVVALKEQEDLLDEPEARQIGNFLHKLLEDTYQIFLNAKLEINKSFERKFLQEFQKRFDAEFQQRMKSDSFMLNYIMRYRLERFLKTEVQRQQQISKLLGLELDVRDTISLCGQNVMFRCKIDRIEKLLDGSVLIIDYKSGSINSIPKSLSKLRAMNFTREEIAKGIQSFQLPIYLHFMQKRHPDMPLTACLYSLRNGEMAFFPQEKEVGQTTQIMQICLQALAAIYEEIINPELSFAPSPNTSKSCEICEFSQLCR